tara:strand:- start:70 stop:804 length:735 start_codon:yes stop_codon:yes gene_type:complete
MPNRKILKVRDKTDGYYKKVDKIFDLPFRILINGKSQLSGKTTIILNLLLRNSFYRNLFDGSNIFIVSNNRLDNKLKILMEQKSISKTNFMKYDEEELEILYDQLEEEFMDEVNEGMKPSARLIIFDDVAYSGSLKDKTAGILSKIVMNGRHANISSIFTSQKFSLVSTGIRTNVTGAILFNTSQKELELIADDFNYLENKKDFIKMFRKATDGKNKFLVVNFSNDRNEMYLDSEFKPITQGSD